MPFFEFGRPARIYANQHDDVAPGHAISHISLLSNTTIDRPLRLLETRVYQILVEFWLRGGAGATLARATTKPKFDSGGGKKSYRIIYCASVCTGNINYIDKCQPHSFTVIICPSIYPGIFNFKAGRTHKGVARARSGEEG